MPHQVAIHLETISLNKETNTTITASSYNLRIVFVLLFFFGRTYPSTSYKNISVTKYKIDGKESILTKPILSKIMSGIHKR